MAHQFDSILKAEKHDFIYCRNRYNSKMSLIMAFSKSDQMVSIGSIDNKTQVLFLNKTIFKKQTIDKLIHRLKISHPFLISIS